jgi:hypothetical protein
VVARTRVCYWTGQLLGESVRIGGKSCNILGRERARGLTGPPWFAKSSQSISHCRSIMYLNSSVTLADINRSKRAPELPRLQLHAVYQRHSVLLFPPPLVHEHNGCTLCDALTALLQGGQWFPAVWHIGAPRAERKTCEI